MAKLLKRLGSLALAIIMVASLLPMNVFAETAAEPAAVTVPEGFTGVGTPEELTAAVAKGGKIALTADITLTSKLTVSNTTTFDWNGFTLTLTEKPTESNGTSTYSMYINGGTIVFKDSSAAGDGGLSITGAKNYVQGVRVGGGTLQVDSGKYYLQGNSGSSMLLFYTWRKTTFNGGTIEAVNNGSGSASAVYAADNSNTAVTINGGTFNATCNSGSPYAINVASSTSTKYVNFPDSGKTVTVNAKGAGSVYGIYNGATMSIDNPKLTVNAECTYTGTSSRYVRPLYNGRSINVTAGNFNGTETGSSTTVYVYGMANGRITKTEKVDGVDTTVEVCQGYGTVSGGTFTATAPQRTYGINMDYADPEKGFTVTGNAVVTASTAALQPWRGTVNITGGTYYANTPFSKNDACTLTVTGGKFKSADKRGMVEVKTYLDETYAQDSDGTVKLKTELTPWITVDGTGYYWIADGVAAIKEDGTSVVKLNRDYIYRRESAHIIRAAAAEFDLGGHTWHNCNTSGNALTFEPKDGKTNTHTYLKNGTVISDSNVAIRMSYGTFKLENVTAQAFVALGYYETDAVTYDQKKNVVTNCVLLSSPTVNGYPFSFHLSSTTSKQENVAVYFDNSVLVNVSAAGGAIFRSNSKYGFKGSVYLGENVHMYGGRNQWSSIQSAETGYTAGNLSIYDQNGTKLKLGTFTQSGCLGSNTWTYGDYSKLYLKVTTHGDEIVIPAVPHNCTEDGLLAGAKCAVCGYVTKEQVTDPAAHDTIVKKDGKAPTCVAAGWNDYYQCSICGKYFTDSLGENEIGNETQLEGWKEGDGAIQATGEHTAVHTAAVAPKCTEDGNIEYWQCSVCKKYFSDEACETEIVLAQTVVPQLGHQFGTDGKCTNPGCDEEACKEGHTWGEKVEAQEANCAQGGWAAHYICSACGAYGTDAQTPEVVAYETLLIDVQPDKHTNLVGTPKKDATVYVTGHEAYWTCEGCHKLYADEAAANEISAPVVLPQLTAVAQIGETDKFATLQDAVDASKDGDVIVMLENYTLSASVAFPYGTTRVLDLNGKTINAGAYCLVNAGNLTIKDSATGGKITGTGILIENKLGQGQTVPGNLTIENGTYITSGKKVLNISGGTVVVKNGELAIETTGHGEYHVIEVGSKASLTVDGGKLWIKENTTEKGNSSVATCYDVVHNFGTTVINNGSFEATRNGLCVGSGTTQVRAITPNGGTTTINGGTFKGTKANSTNASHAYAIRSSTSTAVVNINGGTFNSLNIGFIANINKGTFSGSHFINSNGHVTVNGGQFNTGGAYYAFNSPENVKDCKNAWIKVNSMNIVTTTSTQAAVAKTGSVVADYVTIDSVAVIKNGTKKLSYASTVNEIVAAVNNIGSDGNAVVTLLKDVTDNDVNNFTTSFELDMNGKTWVQTTGSAVSVGTAGTAKQVTYIHDGYIYDKGSVAVSISAGAMHLDNVDVYCTSAMPVAYYVRNGNFNAQNLIENSALVTNRYHAFSFRAENKTADEDRQPGVGMTFRNTDLINIYNTTSADGNIFFAGEKLTTGTYTLGEGVNMYTIYSGSYNTDGQKSVVVTEEGVVIHDQLAAKQYPELTAILTPIGEAMGFKEGDIVYGSGTSAAIFTTNPTVYKWTTNHTNEYVSDGNATCTENATTTEKCTATVNGEACGVETGKKGVAENTATDHAYPDTWTNNGENHKKVCGNDATHVLTEAHTYGAWVEGKKTCTACGAEATCDHVFEYTPDGNATCTADGTKSATCPTCGMKSTIADVGSALNHDFVNGTVKENFAGNCQEKSYVTTKCARCDVTDTVYGEVNMSKHADLKQVPAQAPTCTAIGWDAYEYCTQCDYTTYAEKGMLNHTYGDPTFTWAETKASATATFTCACGDTKIENGVITSKINTPATCEGKGERTFTATVTFNGVTYTDDVKVEIPAKGHDFENGTVTEEFAGNCQTESFVTTKCARCDVTETVKGAKNPAVHTKLVKDDAKAPTCTETGLTEGEHCEACGTVTKKQDTVDALNHKFENYTNNGDGTHTGVCANDASHTDTAVHNFVNGTCDKCGAAEKINVAEVDGTGYATLAEAIAAADGKTVKLLEDIELTETITIAAGKTITLDLNGKTLVYESTIQGEAMITNKGNLTINDTVGGGVINYNYIGAADSSYGKGNYTISNGGKLTVNGGKITIANLSRHAKYPIDNNSTTGNAVLTINGGHLYNYNTCAIRQFCNSTAYSNIVTINGGLIEGFSAIWMQNPGKNTVNGKLTITGGEIKTTAAAYVNGTSALKDVASKIYCTTEGGAWTADSAVAITGGIINENVYLAEAAPESITIGDATFNGYVQLPGLKGKGTEADPYLIGSVEELILFRDSVNAGEGKYNGAYVKLVADIDLAGINWEPIGNVSYNSKYAPADATKVFSGTFDGNGKVISNLSMTKIMNGGADKDANVGLFGITGEGATIKNLTLTNVTINTDGRNVGALAGVTYMATLDNITVNGNIQIKGGNNVSAVGGMTRYSNVSATNITVVGNDGSSIVGNNIVGGIFAEIAPKSGCTFSNLTVENVAISGVGGVGGIVGLLTTGTVENVSVKDVALTGKTEYQGNAMGRIRLGSVAGLMGGKFATIANATVENVTAKNLDGDAVVLPVIGANYDASSNATEAKIGNTYYATFAAAYAAAKAGDTVELLQPIVVAAGETLTLDKDVTIAYSSSKQEHEAMITNNGTLVVDGTTIVFTYTGKGDPNFGWGSYTIRNEGNLTVNSGTVKFEGTQAFGTHCSQAIFQYSGSTTINGGNIINNAYRSLRLWKGDVTIKGGTFEGQVWVQCVDNSAKLTITGGTFAPATSGDASSVFVSNAGKTADLAVTGGTFATKIGANDVAALAGAITGGKFTEAAKNGTNAALYEGMVFGNADADGYYTLEEGLKGKGTEADPYQIGSIADLILFRDSVNAGETRYNAPGVYVALTADIDMAGINWVGIGSAYIDHGFMGNFDGKGFKIKNLTITDPAVDSDGYVYAGLFSVTEGIDKENQNIIKNLTIENVTISAKGDIVAAAIAYPYYTIVENVTVCGDINITGGNYTAGALAYTRRCVNASNVTVSGNAGSTITGNITVGGVISDIQMNGGLTANYSNFAVSGVKITGQKQVGGISGIICEQTLNGATVKNVELVCQDARVGIVSGCLGGTSTISNVVTENVTGADVIVGGDYNNGIAAAAKIGDTYYTTFAKAYAAAEAGETVELLQPIVVAKGETLTLDKDVNIVYTSNVVGEDMITVRGTLNVAAGKITYTNTDKTGNNVTVSTISCEPGSVLNVTGGTIENKTVYSTGSYAYAIDLLTNGNLGDVTATISGGKVYSDYMAIRQFNNGTACKNALTVTGGEIYGAKRAIQVHMDNNAAYLTIEGGKIGAGEGGYALCLFPATATNIAVKGGTFSGTVYSATNGIISGGIFNEEVYEGYCAEGYLPTDNGDGTYGVIQGLKGKGTEADPYQIGTLEELILFRDTVNAGKTYYNAPGVYVALTADIDMAGINWVGIGSINMDHGFMGNFDGKGFKIKNLTITDPAVDSDGYAYAGFFSITEGEKDAENVIKNLTIENVTISTNGHIVSAAIAYPYYTTVENVTVCGDINITGGDYTAGALAYTRRCVNASNVTVSGNAGSTITGKSTVGGVISDIQMNGGLIANYSNFAASGLTITGNSCVGGISGIICKQTLNGATVKDVTLVCGKATVGTVAGSWGDVSTITDVVVENVTGATAVIGATYKESKAVEAKIGDTYYATFAAAYAAAQANDTITLLADLTASEIIVIDKAITLDGNGKTLTSTATRAINVNCADKVLIKDLTIATTANTERAINVIQKAADLTLENVTAEGFKYTLFVAGSSVGSDITVNGGKLSGYAAINIAGNNTTVTVNNAELVGVNNVPAHASNAFAVINIGEADGAVVTVKGGSLTATSTTGNRQFAVSGFYATNAKVTVDAELNLANGDVFNGKVEQIAASFRAEYADELLAKGYMTKTSATTGLVDVAGVAAASVNGFGYTKLQDAIDAAEALGEATVVVLNNQDLTSHIIISDGITLDLNGKTVKTTRYFTVYGDVVDGTAGGEGIVIAAKTHVMGQKSFMSIYDSAAGGYRFYAFEVVSAGFKDVDATTVKFGIKLEFVNAEAYTLIANSDTKLELHALITWTGLAAPMDYIFSDATVKSYASLVAADLANSGSTKKAITLTFTGVEVLGEDGQINVTPVLESETNISGAAATINWKANS